MYSKQYDDRDEAFIAWWCHAYPDFCLKVLAIGRVCLPTRIYRRFERVVVDTAEPMGKLAGSLYLLFRRSGE